DSPNPAADSQAGFLEEALRKRLMPAVSSWIADWNTDGQIANESGTPSISSRLRQKNCAPKTARNHRIIGTSNSNHETARRIASTARPTHTRKPPNELLIGARRVCRSRRARVGFFIAANQKPSQR